MRWVICLPVSTVIWIGRRTISCQSVSVHGVSYGRKPVIQSWASSTQPSAIKFEIITEKLEVYESLVTDQIRAAMIQLGNRTICSKIQKLINSVWNKKKLTQRWKESNIVPIYKKVIKQTVVIMGAYHFCHPHVKFYPPSCCQGSFQMQAKF